MATKKRKKEIENLKKKSVLSTFKKGDLTTREVGMSLRARRKRTFEKILQSNANPLSKARARKMLEELK